MTAQGNRVKADWEIELEAWSVANEARLRAEFDPHRTVANEGKPEVLVDDLVRAAKAARQRPEIWSIFLSLRDREKEDPEASLTSDEISLCGRFARWFRMRNSLDDMIQGYIYLPGLLRKYALNEIQEADDEMARQWLLQFPFVRKS